MGTSIEQKIALLPSKIQEKFREDLIDVCEDRFWIKDHRLIYSAPDIRKIKEVLFEEEYKSYVISNKNN